MCYVNNVDALPPEFRGVILWIWKCTVWSQGTMPQGL
jgi:hypothetical protein